MDCLLNQQSEPYAILETITDRLKDLRQNDCENYLTKQRQGGATPYSGLA